MLINNVQKKLFATQVKNFVAQVEQLAQDELLTHRTRDIFNTDFADPELLLSDKHFEIAKICSAKTALSDCWKTRASGKDKVSYKLLSKASTFTYTTWSVKTIILKNGMMLSYIHSPNSKRDGYLFIDINGNAKPNIGGRDLFCFYISPKGKLLLTKIYDNLPELSVAQLKNVCLNSNYLYCIDLLILNNWKMDY